MTSTASQKADVLIEAVKYIKKFDSKIIVVKYGGNAMESGELQASVFEDVSVLWRLGLQVVIVHGGGPRIDTELKRIGLKKKTIDGLRVTDDTTMDIVEQCLDEVNQECVQGLKKASMPAKNCTTGVFKTVVKDERLGHVGTIVEVDTFPLLRDLAYGVIPVISSIGKDEHGQLHNINADTAATKLAVALEAEKLTILTNVNGVLDEAGQRIAHLDVKTINQWIADGTINGGMIPKVQACAEAASHGVAKAHLLDGRIPRALLLEIYTDEGIGTEIVA